MNNPIEVFNKTYSCTSQSYFVRHIFIYEKIYYNMNQNILVSKNIKKSLQQNVPMVFESYLYHLELLEDIEITE